MITRVYRTASLVALGVLLWAACPARAETPGGGNLIGHRGLLRMAAADNHQAGWIGIGTDFQFFQAGDLIEQSADHSRMVNTFSLVYAPIRYMEAAAAFHVTSDRSSGGAAGEELMVAVGDPELSLKGGGGLGHGIAVGGVFDIRFPSGAGFFESALSSTTFLFAALASYTVSPDVPLSIHLNAGFQYDGSDNLFEDKSGLSPAQLYAAQVSSFHRVVARLGLEYMTRYVGPFVELSLEPFVGGGAPGFGDSPGIISAGARAWPTSGKSLQLLAAVDVGVTGVGDGQPRALDAGKYAYVIPRWNLVLRLSYRFDAYAEPEVRTVERPGEGGPGGPVGTGVAEARGSIAGKVVDAKTGEPVWSARVKVEGEQVSTLAVDPNGEFTTFEVPVGSRTLVAKADGYAPATVQVDVSAGEAASTTIELTPRSAARPGTLRGTIKALRGRSPRKSTILIPSLDRTIRVRRSGAFSVELKPGVYKIVISSRGFRTQTKKIRVVEGETVILNVELHR